MSLLDPSIVLAVMLVSGVVNGPVTAVPAPLDQQLRREDPGGAGARRPPLGDARRGALVFYQPALTCTRCHVERTGRRASDPRARPGRDRQGSPRRRARRVDPRAVEGRSRRVTSRSRSPPTTAGRSPACWPRNGPTPSSSATPARTASRSRSPGTGSSSRAGGARRSCRPGWSMPWPPGSSSSTCCATSWRSPSTGRRGPAPCGPTRHSSRLPLPEYERRLDHAGLIAGLGPTNFSRGEAIYTRVCANCHGTKDQPGSLPDAPAVRLRDAQERQRPLSACIAPSPTASARWRPRPGWSRGRSTTSSTTSARRTSSRTTRASMPPIDRAYLDRLPKGTGRGPAPSEIEPWVAMDYGPSLMATYRSRRQTARTSPTRGSPSGSTRGRGVSRGARLGALRPRHAPPRRRLDRPGLHRLERHQLQRPTPGPSPGRRPGPRRQPGRSRLGQPGRSRLRRPPRRRPRRPALRPAAAHLGPLPGPVPPRRAR